MLRICFGILTCVFFGGCRPLYNAPRPYQVYPQRAEFFQSVLNSDSAPSKAQDAPDIILEEQSYPIQLKLYKSGHFHYRLRKLGDGEGQWTYEDGHLKLYAERKLFVMNFTLHSIDPVDSDALGLEFSDRFGPKYLKLSHKEL
ncbi:MAG: hypothetical protein NTX25_16020 [Proteobacteria bacterium]|nr:hypothetical protein [Pseudomonadota bacterium]